MKRNLKNLIFTFCICFLCAPLTQWIFHIPQPSLHGVYYRQHLPEFNLFGWLELTWQESFSSWYETNVGFRPWLIKIRNQIDWALDKKALSAVTVGKEEYLFESPYIDAYTGKDFIGLDSATRLFGDIIRVSHQLDKAGVPVLHVIAPNKAKFYPHFIPDVFEPWKKGITNYDVVLHLFNQTNIRTIDFSKWYNNIRDSCQRLLYSKSGIHWTIYGAGFAADSIIRVLSGVTHAGKISNRILGEVQTNEPVYPDGDLKKLLNLFYTSYDEEFTYPEWQFVPSEFYKAPKVLFVGDSYFWTLCKSSFFSKALSPLSEYWYYSHDLYTNKDSFASLVRVVGPNDKERMFNDFDAIVFIHTEPSLDSYGFGFFSQAK